MEPTFHSGQPYLLNTHAFRGSSPQRGEVVVFRRNNVTYIKRVTAVGGDSLLLVRNRGADGDELVDKTLAGQMRRLSTNPVMRGLVQLRTLKVPAGSVYVTGDALQASEDSRSYGPIPISSILGQVSAPPPPASRPIAADFRSPTRL